MGTIYKRKGENGRRTQRNWMAQTTINGKRRSRSFREKAEAKHWLAQVEAGIAPANSIPGRAMPEHSIESSAVITVAQALTLYAEAAPRHLSALTWHSCQAPIVSYWQRQPLAQRAIHDIFQSDIKQWISECRAESRPAGTIRKRLNVLKQAIDLGLERIQSGQRNPAAGHRIKRDPKHRRRPTSNEKVLLYRYAKECQRPLAYWAMRWAEECGMRRAEIARLKHEDIDFSHVPPLLTVRFAKTQPRRFYMWPQLVTLYRQISEDLSDKVHVFGGIRADSITQAFERVRSRAGVAQEVSFHSFRYEANSWMAETHVPRKLRMQIIGHVSDEMSDHYTEFSEVASELMASASSSRS